MTDPTHFLKHLSAIRLSANERLRLRERLAAYADMHPLVNASPAPVGVFGFFASHTFTRYASALVAVFVIGSSVTFAADTSVPGDALYGVKIHVNEPVMTALAPTDAGQARVAAALATRRVDEAVVLARKGALSDAKRVYLAEAFDTQVDKATKRANDLAQSGDLVAAESVKADLAVQLAGEAQALSSAELPDETGTRPFLALVVATSDAIGDAASVTTTLALADEAPAEDAPMLMTAASASTSAPLAKQVGGPRTLTRVAAKSATTTPRSLVSGRFGKRLFISATTTLRVQLNTNAVLIAPKTDSALAPSLPAPTGAPSATNVLTPPLED